MKASKLKIGDRIRVIAVPGVGIPNHTIQRETVRVYKKIIARKRAVIINKIDEFGSPWYTFKFKATNGTWHWHSLIVDDDDNNWVRVKPRLSRTNK
jgi:hypothetical protein